MSDLRMPDLNQVTIAGRLTRDPELKHTGAGKPYARLSIANTRYYKQDGDRREDTAFVNITLWGQPAEWVSENLTKGRPVIVEGRLQSNEWTDKDGNKRRDLTINAQKVSPLDWDGEKGDGQTQQRPAQQQASQPAQEPMPEDDIPF